MAEGVEQQISGPLAGNKDWKRLEISESCMIPVY